MNNYNEILKSLFFLERNIEYKEVLNDDIFAIVITKDNKVIYSSFCSIDDFNVRINTYDKVRLELSTYIVSAILKSGLNISRENTQTFEEYEKALNKLVNQKYYGKKAIE